MIEKVERGCIARNKKLNEVIDHLNPLLDISVKINSLAYVPKVTYTDNGVLITLPESGGVPSGYTEELFDVVLADNTAGQRYLLSKSV